MTRYPFPVLVVLVLGVVADFLNWELLLSVDY